MRTAHSQGRQRADRPTQPRSARRGAPALAWPGGALDLGGLATIRPGASIRSSSTRHGVSLTAQGKWRQNTDVWRVIPR